MIELKVVTKLKLNCFLNICIQICVCGCNHKVKSNSVRHMSQQEKSGLKCDFLGLLQCGPESLHARSKLTLRRGRRVRNQPPELRALGVFFLFLALVKNDICCVFYQVDLTWGIGFLNRTGVKIDYRELVF